MEVHRVEGRGRDAGARSLSVIVHHDAGQTRCGKEPVLEDICRDFLALDFALEHDPTFDDQKYFHGFSRFLDALEGCARLSKEYPPEMLGGLMERAADVFGVHDATSTEPRDPPSDEAFEQASRALSGAVWVVYTWCRADPAERQKLGILAIEKDGIRRLPYRAPPYEPVDIRILRRREL